VPALTLPALVLMFTARGSNIDLTGDREIVGNYYGAGFRRPKARK